MRIATYEEYIVGTNVVLLFELIKNAQKRLKNKNNKIRRIQLFSFGLDLKVNDSP